MNQIQEKIIQVFNSNGGKLPSFRKLAQIVGVSSTNTIAYHIDRLKKNGYLEIGKAHQGVAKFSVKSILNLERKPGLYVLLKKNKPFYLATGQNIKEDIIKNVIGVDACPISNLDSDIENITIAYHIIENPEDQEELKRYLIDMYNKQGHMVQVGNTNLEDDQKEEDEINA